MIHKRAFLHTNSTQSEIVMNIFISDRHGRLRKFNIDYRWRDLSNRNILVPRTIYAVSPKLNIKNGLTDKKYVSTAINAYLESVKYRYILLTLMDQFKASTQVRNFYNSHQSCSSTSLLSYYVPWQLTFYRLASALFSHQIVTLRDQQTIHHVFKLTSAEKEHFGKQWRIRIWYHPYPLISYP